MNDEGRTTRAGIARETMEILQAGRYRAGGVDVEIADALARSVSATEALWPSAMRAILELARGAPRAGTAAPRVEVMPESTLAAARRLLSENGGDRVVCLNFASARRPG